MQHSIKIARSAFNILRTTAARLAIGLALIASFAPANAHAVTPQRVAAGDSHTLVITSDGVLWAWGDNIAGQLGNGTRTTATRPVKIGEGFAQVSAAHNHSLAIKRDGSLWAWGDNDAGQLGTGTTRFTTVPVAVGTGFVQVSTGTMHTLAIKADGSLWAWGANSSAQLGFAPSVSGSNVLLTPTQVGVGYAQVAAGGSHTLAVKTDASLWAWGHNGYGQVGNGSNDGVVVVPTQIGTGYASASAGAYSSSAVRADGTFWEWGTYGGLSSWGSIRQPVQSRVDVAQAVAGNCYNLTLTTDSTLIAKNQCNDWVFSQGYVSEALVGRDFVQASTGGRHAVGLKRDGSVWVWGDNSRGQLGNGTTTLVTRPSAPRPVPVASDISQVAAGYQHALALHRDGTLLSWGYGDNGQLGTGTTVQSNTLQPVGTGFAQIAAGGNASFAIKADATLWSWGDNRSGQLGNGGLPHTSNFQNRWSSTPSQIGTGIAHVAAGRTHAAALQTDGTLWTWGNNYAGQLGNGSTIQADTPQSIGSGFVQATIQSNGITDATFALDSNGLLSAWGSPVFTAVYGNGSTVATPATQFDTRRFTSVTVADGRVDATKADGSVWVPFNASGTTVADLTRPRLIETGFVSQTEWATAPTGQSTQLALKADGTLWGWGDNQFGQLGTNLPATVASPLMLGSGFKALATGSGYALALKTDGSLLGWGDSPVLEVGRNPINPTQVVLQATSSGHALNGQIMVAGSSENLTLTATLLPDPAHTQGHLFFVAILPDGRVFTNTQNGWLPLDAIQREGYGSGLRNTQVDLLIGVNTADLKGTHIYLGYGLGATATESWDEMLASQRFKLGTTL